MVPGAKPCGRTRKTGCGRVQKRVIFEEIDTFEREAGMAWEASDALFVDGQGIRTGPPPSYEKIRRQIEKRVKRLVRTERRRSAKGH